MKNTCLLLFLFCLCFSCCAQGVFSNQTNSTLEKVVKDYPSQFKNIKGEQLSSTAGLVAYKSTIAVPGAVSTVITQSTAARKSTISWQSVLYADNTFNGAKTRFEELFNQIKNTIIKPEGGKAVIVNGMYVDPSADNTFTTIQFDLLPATGAMQQVCIDLVLRNTGKQWKIFLNVYDKDMRDQEALTAR
jgi:hypothetical protein